MLIDFFDYGLAGETIGVVFENIDNFLHEGDILMLAIAVEYLVFLDKLLDFGGDGGWCSIELLCNFVDGDLIELVGGL
jgi:hypothetical protein